MITILDCVMYVGVGSAVIHLYIYTPCPIQEDLWLCAITWKYTYDFNVCPKHRSFSANRDSGRKYLGAHGYTISFSPQSFGPFKALFWLPEDVSWTNISDSTTPQVYSALQFTERVHSLGLLSSSWQFHDVGKPLLVPTSQMSRIQGSRDCEFGGRALMEPDPTLPRLALLSPWWNGLPPSPWAVSRG